MARTAIVAISRQGAAPARALHHALTPESTIFLQRRFVEAGDDATAFDLPLRPVIHRLFGEYQALVLFMPVGAAVRLLAPGIKDKHQDPAVVCVDDAGRFAVSLLSGHLGGADLLAQRVAEALGTTAVITSGSHVTGTLAVDLLGREFGWTIEASPPAVTRASAAVVNSEPVGVFQEAGEADWWPEDRPLPDNITIYQSWQLLAESGPAAALVITDRQAPDSGGQSYREALGEVPLVIYRPRSLVAGMGCRRGVPVEELEKLLLDIFQQHNLSVDSLGCIATADLKKDEVGLLALAEKYSVPLACYSGEELNDVFRRPEVIEARNSPSPSKKAHSLLGIWGVAEPAALLASGSRELLHPRQKTSRATIAIARKSFGNRSTPELATHEVAG